MKNFIILFIVSGFLFSACNPSNKIAKKFISKKYLAALEKERKAFDSTISSLVLDTIRLDSAIKNLLTENKNLIAKYSCLMDSSMTKTEFLSNALKIKTEELKQKEKLLSDNEKKLRELYNKVNKMDSISKILENTVKNALLGFNTDELSVETKNNKIYISLSDKLLFKTGSAKVEAKGKEAIKKVSEVLLKNPDIDILIEGHTDNVPIKNKNYSDNWDLSVARATTIVRILCEEYKVPPHQLTAAGRGEFFPKASNETSEGKAKNRRTEIILSPKLDELFKIIQ